MQLKALQKSPETVIDFLEADRDDPTFNERKTDLDKAWHAIHFLLTGSAEGGEPPLSLAVAGGSPLGDIDFGYDKVRYLTEQEVREVYLALSAISVEEIEARFSLKELSEANIYPNVWEDHEEEIDYVTYFYKKMVEFFRRAAEFGYSILKYTI